MAKDLPSNCFLTRKCKTAMKHTTKRAREREKIWFQIVDDWWRANCAHRALSLIPQYVGACIVCVCSAARDDDFGLELLTRLVDFDCSSLCSAGPASRPDRIICLNCWLPPYAFSVCAVQMCLFAWRRYMSVARVLLLCVYIVIVCGVKYVGADVDMFVWHSVQHFLFSHFLLFISRCWWFLPLCDAKLDEWMN